ncbi:MAG: DUF177 domain-containing protein [Propionibacteriaceae bacterium]|jgi:uncharacterized protein|nr:DUF177 domain-containing protein [Propionibacteriaceae bacterium]
MSEFSFSARELTGRVGAAKSYEREAPAPEDWGTDLIGVPIGSPVDLEVTLEAAGDGIWVTGTAAYPLHGNCSRCLRDIDYDDETDFEELYFYPEHLEDDDASAVIDDHVDLEPLLRDQVLLSLPFSPLCTPDCLGLCAECGFNLNDDPEHAHEAATDPRWDALKDWSR